jgi:aryl-alcohol dehydrogenase-like predicted oxidoreductase
VQAEENARAADITLASEDLAKMDAIGRTVADHFDDDPVLWS